MSNHNLENGYILLEPYRVVGDSLEAEAEANVDGVIFLGTGRVPLDATAEQKAETLTGLAAYMAKKLWPSI